MKKFLLSISIFGLFILLPSSAFATSSTITLNTATITTDSRDQFNHNENPSVSIHSKSTLAQNISKFFNTLRGKPSAAQATIIDPQGEIILEKTLKSGTNNLTVENEKLSPGQYKITVNDQELTTFRWGVLTLNTDQDSYRPGENIYFQAASLSETGHTLCNSNLKLTVSGQVIPLKKSETCGANNVTDTPDYFANYQLTTVGSYVAELTNLDNNFKITQTINIVETTPFTIKRVGATRINPFKADYTMTIKVKANLHGYSGEIKEQLPTGFTALSPITWTTDLKSGEEKIFTYTYRAPKVSPEIFNLGPIIIGAYQESRIWSLASDATFQMQTGYYIGTGVDNFAITGVGFQPDLVLIKDDTGNGTDGVNWKSSAMAGEISQVLGDGDVDVANNAIQSLDSDGFTLGTDADVNAANIRYVWTAFGGSDCTSSGTFCVGSYAGNNGATQAITSVGFQPNYVAIKSSSALVGSFMTSSMATNVSQRFDANNETTDGTRIVSLDATGFTVGSIAAVNDTPNTYWFFAFKTTSGAFAEGTYTGNGSTQSPTVGFKPSYVMVKIANATVAEAAVFNQSESNSDYSGSIIDAANTTNLITSLDSNGFTVGSDAQVNENTKTHYWVAFGGTANPAGSGTYSMKVGTYTGNGTTQSITGVGFTPSLIIVKDETAANYGVFRTKLMKGDTTAYLSSSTSNFTGGITSIDNDGFSVGASVTVNTNTTVYHYIAFGNAFDPETNTGAADFSLVSYTGNGGDNRNILRLPFQPDLVALKSSSAVSGMWRTSDETGDNSLSFTNVAEAADSIQALNSDGFQVGTTRVNVSGTVIHGFTFKASNTLVLNNYTGTASAQNITSVGFSPDLLWVKNATSAVNGVFRSSTLAGDSTWYFTNTAAVADRITAFISNGFSIGGNRTETNTSSSTYRFASWDIPVAPNTPTLDSPADGATGQSLTPALLTTGTDDNTDYLRYKIELCTNVGMTTGCQTFDQTSSQTGWSGQNTQTSTAYTSGTQATYTIQSALSGSTTYYWRSYTIDPGGTNVWSGTQTPRSFTTLDPGTPPNTPSLIAPTDTASNQSTHPTIQTSTTDVESDYLRYKIELCTNVGMTTGCQTFDQTSSQTGWSGQDTETSTAYTSGSTASYTVVTALSPGTTYYYRSYAKDPGGTNTWSSTQGTPYSFTTRTAYESFSCLIDEAIDDSSLTISWSDRESAETNFRLEKNTDNGGFVAYQTLAANTVSYLDTTVAQGHTYQYRIAPYFSSTSTYGNWCTTSTLSLAAGNFQFENINFR